MIESIINADYERLGIRVDEAMEQDFDDAIAAVLAHALVLNDDDDTAATDRLSFLGYSAGKSLMPLIEALRCNDDWSRAFAAEILADAADVSELAIPGLIIALGDEDHFVRSKAVDALRR